MGYREERTVGEEVMGGKNGSETHHLTVSFGIVDIHPNFTNWGRSSRGW
jgi:hypothetical protein